MVDIRKYPEQGIFWNRGKPYLSKLKIPYMIYFCFEGFNWNLGEGVVAGLGGSRKSRVFVRLGECEVED